MMLRWSGNSRSRRSGLRESFYPIPCEIGRGIECRDIYLSGKIESVDDIRNAVRTENRRTRHDLKVEMRPEVFPEFPNFPNTAPFLT